MRTASGSAIVVLAATTLIPAIPAIGLVLLLSVDWFIGIARALGNYVGNCVATVAVASWEGDIDREKAHRVLSEVAAIDIGTSVDPVGIAASGARLRRPEPVHQWVRHRSHRVVVPDQIVDDPVLRSATDGVERC